MGWINWLKGIFGVKTNNIYEKIHHEENLVAVITHADNSKTKIETRKGLLHSLRPWKKTVIS